MLTTRKIITVDTPIDVQDVIKIIDTPQFQKLRFRKQLGCNDHIFPRAKHTRFEHCIQVFDLTRERCAVLQRRGEITTEDAWQVSLFSLVHDIGHPAYSHITEEVLGESHDDHGAEVVAEIADAIRACGGDVAFIQKLMRREHPLADIVMNTPLGTDKLDYLRRDARMTDMPSFPTGDFINWVYWDGLTLVADIKILFDVRLLDDLYRLMYHRVYLRKSGMIRQRFMQRMTLELLSPVGGEKPELTKKRAWECTDSDLDHYLSSSRLKRVRHWFLEFQSNQMPKTAFAFRQEAFVHLERVQTKELIAAPAPPQLFTEMAENNPNRLRRVEQAVAAYLKIAWEDILIVPTAAPRRFGNHPIQITDGVGKIVSLRQLCPEWFAARVVEQPMFDSVRVCVRPTLRGRIAKAKHTTEILRIMLETR